MELTSQEKSQIRGLINSPQWKTIERVAEELCQKIKSDVPIRDNQWETLRTLLEQEGKVAGIKQFLQELFLQAE